MFKRKRKNAKDSVIDEAYSFLPPEQRDKNGARKFLQSFGFPFNPNYWISWEIIIGYHLDSIDLRSGVLFNPADQVAFIIKFYQAHYGKTPHYGDLLALWGDIHEGDLDDNFSEWYEKAYQYQLAA